MADKEILKLGFRAANRLGLENIALKAYDLTTDFADFPVDEEIAEFQLSTQEERGAVLVPLIQGQTGVNAYRYCILAHAFRTRGYRPIVLLCDSGLPICHRKSLSWSDDSVCSVCQFCGHKVLDAFGLDYFELSDLVDPSDYPKRRDSNNEYRDIAVSDFAKASSRKFLKKYHLADSEPDSTVHDQFLTTSEMIVDAVEALIQDNSIKAALAHDDKYVYGGVPLAVATKHGIPAYSHCLGYRSETVVFGKTTNVSSLPWFSDQALLERRLLTPLKRDEQDQINRFMANRASGSGDSQYRYSSFSDRSIEVGERFTVGMFTNLIWDASLEHDTAAYPDVFDWIQDTIENFDPDTDFHLVVKTHPAEALRGTNESVREWITDNVSVGDNVTILPPDTDVDTYNLISDLDAGVVYNSMVGLEMSYFEVPVLVGGETHYRLTGAVYSPSDSDEYLSYLSDIRELAFTTEMKSAVDRYLYYLFFQKHIPFPYYDTGSTGHEVVLKPISHSDVSPGSEPFDTIVDRCVSGEPITQFKDDV